jgi:phage terminase small subunit
LKAQKAPNKLQVTGRNFWKKVLSEYELNESHDLERLSMAAKCLDELRETEQRVKKDGRFLVNRYGNLTEHPGSKTIRDTRLLFVKIIRELGLDVENPEDPRPPRGKGY